MALLCSYFVEYVVFNNYVIEYIFEVYVKYVVVTQRAVMEFFNSCFIWFKFSKTYSDIYTQWNVDFV